MNFGSSAGVRLSWRARRRGARRRGRWGCWRDRRDVGSESVAAAVDLEHARLAATDHDAVDVPWSGVDLEVKRRRVGIVGVGDDARMVAGEHLDVEARVAGERRGDVLLVEDEQAHRLAAVDAKNGDRLRRSRRPRVLLNDERRPHAAREQEGHRARRRESAEPEG
jgi:hypothetical protein